MNVYWQQSIKNPCSLFTRAMRSISSHCDVRSYTETDKLIIKYNLLFTGRKPFQMSVALAEANQPPHFWQSWPCCRQLADVLNLTFPSVPRALLVCSGAQSRGSTISIPKFRATCPLCCRRTEADYAQECTTQAQGGEYLGTQWLQKPYLVCYLWAAKGRKPDWLEEPVFPKPLQNEGYRGDSGALLWMFSTRRNVQGENLPEQFCAFLLSQDYHKASKNSALYPFFSLQWCQALAPRFDTKWSFLPKAVITAIFFIHPIHSTIHSCSLE